MQKSIRNVVAGFLIATILSFAEAPPKELTVPRFSVQGLEAGTLASASTQSPDQNASSAAKPSARKRSGKTKWIVIGAVAAGVTAGLIVANKRFENEGTSIFGFRR